jgi:sec-independent protein translocase protein TatB
MFDLDISKMIIVGIVALAVIPPKDLPRVMRTVGQTVGKMRRMAAEFQGQFMEAMREVEREADLDSVKKEFQAISDQAKIDTSFDPVSMVRDDVTKAVADPVGSPETGASDSATSEIGTSEIALTSPEPVATAAPADKMAEPETPAAAKSAAE